LINSYEFSSNYFNQFFLIFLNIYKNFGKIWKIKNFLIFPKYKNLENYFKLFQIICKFRKKFKKSKIIKKGLCLFLYNLIYFEYSKNTKILINYYKNKFIILINTKSIKNGWQKSNYYFRWWKQNQSFGLRQSNIRYTKFKIF